MIILMITTLSNVNSWHENSFAYVVKGDTLEEREAKIQPALDCLGEWATEILKLKPASGMIKNQKHCAVS